MTSGFLGTGAPFAADLNLSLQVLMGLSLAAGAVLARRRKYRAHGFCQAAVVLLNLALIFRIMLPHFHGPAAGDLRRTLAFAHGLLGIAAELLGLYIVLVAATPFVPARLRFSDYKPWMRTALALWWTVIALGVGTYAAWYGPRSGAAAAAPAAPVKAGEALVTVAGFEFSPKELTVRAGTVVRWTGLAGMHSVVADDGSFHADDAAVNAGRFERRFDAPGDFPYSCEYHGDKGGKGMSGVIHVVAAP